MSLFSTQNRHLPAWLGLSGVLVFLLLVSQIRPPVVGKGERPADVVIPAAAQVVLYGGDRFLAASVESVRAAASGEVLQGEQGSYRLRAHRIVSQLNPCHEDNYWVGNAALSWGGAAQEGSELLGRASQCRFWDELPPFLYGFNMKFFSKDVARGRAAVELAADRATVNAAGFRQIAIMMTVNAIKDAYAAREMLTLERDRARDPKLKVMLERRIDRINGLVVLIDAQRVFEKRFGRPLKNPEELLQSGTLKAYPSDPLKLGYEFVGGEFRLKQLQISGIN